MATPDETKARAVAQVWKGRATREVAAEFGVSHVQVSRWVKAAGPRPTVPSSPPPADAPAPTKLLSLEAMLLVIQGQMQSAIEIAEAAKKVGHHDAAARALRQFGQILPPLMAALKRVGEEKDVLKIPVSELEAAKRSIAERMQAYTAHEVRCFDCGRRLRATTAGLAEDAQARLFDHTEKPRDTK